MKSKGARSAAGHLGTARAERLSGLAAFPQRPSDLRKPSSYFEFKRTSCASEHDFARQSALRLLMLASCLLMPYLSERKPICQEGLHGNRTHNRRVVEWT
jgi:hypothetical protein